MLEYQIIKRMYPFAGYIKYLAGDDLSEDQIVSIFKGEKVKCTVHFAYPSKKRLAKSDVYGKMSAGGVLICDLNVWANKERTDIYWEYSQVSLKQMLSPDKDPAVIERRRTMTIIMCFIVMAVIIAAVFWFSLRIK